MKKLIAFNLDLIYRKIYKDEEIILDFGKELDNMLKNSQNDICFYSRNIHKVNNAREAVKGCYNVVLREDIKNKIRNSESKEKFVIVGRKDKDFEMAVNNKILFIVPGWLEAEKKAKKYGILVDTPKQMFQFIKTLNNQNYWYSVINVTDTTKVLSLMDARYGGYADSLEEKVVIQNFHRLLKEGDSRDYYEVLLYHFLAGMTNDKMFDDITIWGIIPSSTCQLNNDMMDFKEKVRYIKKCYEPKNSQMNNILIRHTRKDKAHYLLPDKRKKIGAVQEFNTLMIDPAYKQKIKKLKSVGKFNVCIFDDYRTYGNTFEAVRNLFESLGANKIICVALGDFRRTYHKNDYSITGDVYSENYQAQPKSRTTYRRAIIHDEAKNEVSNLYNIFNKKMKED